jgi:general secretion pathway protein I
MTAISAWIKGLTRSLPGSVPEDCALQPALPAIPTPFSFPCITGTKGQGALPQACFLSNRPSLQLPRQGGFTLLEVMIAIALLAIALTTLFGSQAQSVSLAATVRFNTQAPLLAQLKMAELSGNADRPAADSGDFGEDFPGFQWQLESKEVLLATSKIVNKLSDSLQRLILTVSWGEKGQYSYQLESYVLKKPEP